MIKDKLSLLTSEPGCYLMKNSSNQIIYVGKAKNLKRRVSSYFNKEHTGKTKALVENIVDFEYIVTTSEVEALLLEINLIKKYTPKYNILLKDNKMYPYIEITGDKYPRLIISRPRVLKRSKQKNGRLFGPYPDVAAARATVELLNRIYPFRKCKNLGKKTCLYYHIGQCLGYCEKYVDSKIINNMVDEVSGFLKGNYNKVSNKIKLLMEEASKVLNFERAIELKKMLEYIEKVLEKQKISLNDNVDRDIFGYNVYNEYLSIQVFHLRNGRIIQRNGEIFPLVGDISDALTYYVTSFYDTHELPKEVFVSEQFDAELIERALMVNVTIPKIGLKKKLLDMVDENAEVILKERFDLILRDEKRTSIANAALGNLAGIKNLRRIETFDNAHLFGAYTVSGMVVYIDGKPAKKEYRKYKIKSGSKDDYHTMKEVIYRRYFRVLHDKLEMPDLILVDGGIIQVNATKSVLDSLYLDVPVLGIKKNDKHATSCLISEDKEYAIDKNSDLFHYLSRIQDEVHRYTINYHKDIRSKGSLSSILDNVKGIGSKRKTDILKKYKTMTNLKSTTLSELESFLPNNVAVNLYEFLKSNHDDKQ